MRHIFVARWCLSVVLGALFQGSAFTEEQISFLNAVEKFETSRLSIASYCVKVQGIDYVANPELSIAKRLAKRAEKQGDFRFMVKYITDYHE